MHGSHHYGGEHHRVSLIDLLGERMERDLRAVERGFGWDIGFLHTIQPVLDAAVAYFDAEVERFDRVPARGPVMLVGNHSGGMWMPDFWALLRTWIRDRGFDEPLYALGYDLVFELPVLGSIARRLGVVPASHEMGGRLLRAGQSVIVYPGGDEDVFRPWTDRHHIDFHRRMGFVRLALRNRVPLVPVVSHGSHDALVVLSRGDAIARFFRLDRLRVHILPLLTVPAFPLPAKVTVRVCEPFDWSAMPPEAAEDREVVRRCYEEVLGRMQATLDDLVAERPHPILDRVRDPLRRGSQARARLAREQVQSARSSSASTTVRWKVG